MISPIYSVNDIVLVYNEDTNAERPMLISQITITERGIKYEGELGFSNKVHITMYNEGEYRFADDETPMYRVIGKVGNKNEIVG